MAKRIGVIGIGAMGKGIVTTLLTAGYAVTAFDVNKSALSEVVAKGAIEAESPANVGGNSDVVITSLPNPKIFEAVVLESGGLLAAMAEGTYLIDMSTIDPGTTKRIHQIAAEKGVRTLDAPLSGGPQGAASGELTIIVGGDKTDFEAMADVFETLGKSIYHVGPIGAGQTVKVCNNAAAAVHTVVTGEGTFGRSKSRS